jgi:hypothetical protein
MFSFNLSGFNKSIQSINNSTKKVVSNMNQVNQQVLEQHSDVVLHARRLDGDVQKKPEVIQKEVNKLPEGVTLWGDGKATFEKPKFVVSDRDADMFFSGTSIGFPAGKYVGFDKGKDEGLKLGLKQGYQEGKEDGLELGNKQGYQLGYKWGSDEHSYNKGFDAGQNDGFNYGSKKYGLFGAGATATVGGAAWSIAKAVKVFSQTSAAAAAASEGPAAATIGAATGVEAAAAGGLVAAESAAAITASAALAPFAIPALVTLAGVGAIGWGLSLTNTHGVHGV